MVIVEDGYNVKHVTEEEFAAMQKFKIEPPRDDLREWLFFAGVVVGIVLGFAGAAIVIVGWST